MDNLPNKSDSFSTYIINLVERPDRLEHSHSQFERKSEFNITVIEAIRHEVGPLGLWQSIKKCVQCGIEIQCDFIIICEDDHQFTASYNEDTLRQSMAEAKKLNTDILLGGVSWFKDIVLVTSNLVKVNRFTGTQFVLIFKPAFETILTAKFSEYDTADSKFSELFDNIFLIYPIISVQKDFGYSDVTIFNNIDGRVGELFEKSAFSLDILVQVCNYYKDKNINYVSIENEFDFSRTSIPTYIINLKDRIDRLDHIKQQFEQRKEFNIVVTEAVKDTIGAKGLWLSIRRVIEMAIANDDDVIIICEDDHEFTETYSKEIFLKNVIFAQRLGIEYLSGGCSYFEHAVPVTPSLYWVSVCMASQFCILYRPAFKKILSEPYDEKVIADALLSEMITNKMIPYPAISVQKDFGYSDVTSVHNEQKNLVSDMFKQANTRLDSLNQMVIKYNAFCIKSGLNRT